MNRTKIRVFILGAGCSVWSGLPMMTNLFPEFLKFFRHFEKDKLTRDEVAYRLLSTSTAMRSKSTTINVEQLLTEIHATDQLWRLLKQGSSWIFLPNTLSYVIWVLSEFFQHKISSLSDEVESPYTKLANCLRDKDAIITLNWDNLLEQALTSCGIKIGYLRPTPKRVSVFKLHGSIDWLELSEDLAAFHVNTCEPIGYNVYKARFDAWREIVGPISPHYTMSVGKELFLTPLMVPPVLAKSFKGRLFGQIWRSAASAMKQSAKVYVIGYSLPLTDWHMVALLRNSLDSVDPPTMTVIGPSPEAWERYVKMIGDKCDIAFYKARFENLDLTEESSVWTDGALRISRQDRRPSDIDDILRKAFGRGYIRKRDSASKRELPDDDDIPF